MVRIVDTLTPKCSSNLREKANEKDKESNTSCLGLFLWKGSD